MRFLIVLGLAVLLKCVPLQAQINQQQVDQVFAAYAKPTSPGCSLGVIQGGAFLYRKSYGIGNLELGTPLSSESRFYMASVSKQFTAASVVLAAEQGSLSLDDDIHKYIPELPEYGHPITLREMLHHTSGLRDYFSLLGFQGRSAFDRYSADDILALIVKQKALNFTPGSEFAYSNTNYFLLAEVVKRATKKPLSVFAAENIFRPLGMTHTGFYDDHTIVVSSRVPAYAVGDNGSFSPDWSTTFDLVGDGGLLSTVNDLLLWDQNFYANRLGKGMLLKELLAPGVLNNGKKTAYALGLELGSYHGSPVVDHSGGLFGYSSDILRFPKQQFTVVCLCNLAGANATFLTREVADIYFGRKLGRTPEVAGQKAPGKENKRLDDSLLASMTGNYMSTELGVTYALSAESGCLVLRINGASEGALTPAGHDKFVAGFGVLAFKKDSKGRIVGMGVSDGRVNDVAFEKTS